MLKKLAAILGIAIGAMVGLPAIAGAAPVDLGWWQGKYGSMHCVVDWEAGTGECATYRDSTGVYTQGVLKWNVPVSTHEVYFRGGAAGTDHADVLMCGRVYYNSHHYHLARSTNYITGGGYRVHFSDVRPDPVGESAGNYPWERQAAPTAFYLKEGHSIIRQDASGVPGTTLCNKIPYGTGQYDYNVNFGVI